MACEFSANAVQTVSPNQSAIFTETPIPCTSGLVIHRDESGTFLLVNNARNVPCNNRGNYMTDYIINFHANIAIPEGGTVEPIQIAVVIDGDTDPSSIMEITPAAVEQYFNVGASVAVSVPAVCGCSNISIRNISVQDILIQNANLLIDYAGVRRICRCMN